MSQLKHPSQQVDSAMPTYADRRCRSGYAAALWSAGRAPSIKVLSVNSSLSVSARAPVLARNCRTRLVKVNWRSWHALTLTARLRSAISGLAWSLGAGRPIDQLERTFC